MPSSVLIINPYIADFKLYDEWMHPLGLYFLISLLEKNGIETRYFNCLRRDGHAARKFNTGRLLYREIEKPGLYKSIPRKYKLYGRPEKKLTAFLLENSRPDLICIGSMMTHWLPGVAETVKITRTVHPDIPILIGGIAARLMPDALRALAPTAAIGGTLEGTSPLRLHPSLPPLAREEPPSLLGGLKKAGDVLHGPILLSLGCPMACSFCASALLQGKFRLRPIQQVIEETLFLAEHSGIVDFAFFDDALLFKANEGIVPLLIGLSRLKKGLRFHAPNGLHLHYINEEMAATLKSAGFTTLRFGYENGLTLFSDDTNRKADRLELRNKIAVLKNAGFEKKDIGVYVMAGLQGQSPAQVHDEMDFAASCRVKVKPVFLSPVPGTALFERYAADFPQIRTDPLWHNDTFFVTKLPGWNWDEMEKIRIKARVLNQ